MLTVKMVKRNTLPYKQLRVKKQHASNMRVILACLFGVVVLTGIAGHLFSRRATTPSPPPDPQHEVLARLIKTSEDAIGWISNKTINSLNNIKNLTASAIPPESNLVAKKNKLLEWLRRAIHYNSSFAESSEGSSESEERLVIAHRIPGSGFSWGPPKKNEAVESYKTESEEAGLIQGAGRQMHNVFSYFYQTTTNITQRGKDLIQAGINRVKNAKEFLTTILFNADSKPESTTSDELCGDVADPVCAVDWTNDIFTVFKNGCWLGVYNQRHGTNFTIHDSDVCINLFAHHPENYLKIENDEL